MVTSGTAVNQVLTSFPANVSFVINDDLVALEDMEIYTLSLIPSDPSIVITQATSQITILDNDGGMLHTCTHTVYIHLLEKMQILLFC